MLILYRYTQSHTCSHTEALTERERERDTHTKNVTRFIFLKNLCTYVMHTYFRHVMVWPIEKLNRSFKVCFDVCVCVCVLNSVRKKKEDQSQCKIVARCTTVGSLWSDIESYVCCVFVPTAHTKFKCVFVQITKNFSSAYARSID